MQTNRRTNRVIGTLALAVALGIALGLIGGGRGAGASQSTQLQVARDQLANCQLLAANSTNAQHTRAQQCVTDQTKIIALLTAPSPTPSASPTATSTPSPSPTVTSSPTPTPSPTPTGPATGCLAQPSACGFPDATNTGASGSLVAMSGDMIITSPGAVIHDVAISGCVRVDAPNVTFHNVRITCASGGYSVDNGVVRGGNDAYDTGTTTFDHVTIACPTAGGTAIGEARIHAVAVNLSGCENGFDLDTEIVLEDSYVHDLAKGGTTHSDGIQVWAGATNVVLRHNTMLVVGDTSAFITGGRDPGLVITNNLLDGGAYTIYCAGNTGQLTDNRFGPIFPGTGFPAGHTTDCTSMTASGNVEDATGNPAPIG